MILALIYQGFVVFGYANVAYEIYDREKMKKKREYEVKPFFYNRRTMIMLVLILTLLFLSYDYCSNNFGIDLQKEYANYKDKDLMFGKMNICQFAMEKALFETLLFKNPTISYILYGAITLILLVFLYYSGILMSIIRTIFDYLGNIYTLDTIFPEEGYIGNIAKLYKCKGALANTILYNVYDSIFS